MGLEQPDRITNFAVESFFLKVLQSNSRDEYRGRVFGALFTTNALMRLIGIVFATALADVIGGMPLLIVSGLLWVVGGVVAWLMLPSQNEATATNISDNVQAEPVA